MTADPANSHFIHYMVQNVPCPFNSKMKWHQSYHRNLIHPLISRQLKDWLQGIFEFFRVLFDYEIEGFVSLYLMKVITTNSSFLGHSIIRVAKIHLMIMWIKKCLYFMALTSEIYLSICFCFLIFYSKICFKIHFNLGL